MSSGFVVAQPRDGLVPAVPAQPVRRRRGQRPDSTHEQTPNFGHGRPDQELEVAVYEALMSRCGEPPGRCAPASRFVRRSGTDRSAGDIASHEGYGLNRLDRGHRRMR